MAITRVWEVAPKDGKGPYDVIQTVYRVLGERDSSALGSGRGDRDNWWPQEIQKRVAESSDLISGIAVYFDGEMDDEERETWKSLFREAWKV